MLIDALIRKIADAHYPRSPAGSHQIEDLENRNRVLLPDDMKRFYRSYDGASLFFKTNSPFEILPLASVVRARVLIFDKDTDEYGPPLWYGFCDVQDGNYIAIDLESTSETRFSIIDCFHESFPDPEYCGIIASSFSEFLEQALLSHGRAFWLYK